MLVNLVHAAQLVRQDGTADHPDAEADGRRTGRPDAATGTTSRLARSAGPSGETRSARTHGRTPLEALTLRTHRLAGKAQTLRADRLAGETLTLRADRLAGETLTLRAHRLAGKALTLRADRLAGEALTLRAHRLTGKALP
ncbi:MAG: hypothetical protein OEL76_16845, partial [Siculibacillus sp.]|nr:hypothetical protein [Siculibacillus sp.]